MFASSQERLAQVLDKMARRSGAAGGGEEDEDEDSDENYVRDMRKFGGVEKMRKKLRGHPEVAIKEWIRHVREELGAIRRSSAWKMTDYTWHIHGDFGSASGLFRSHYYVSHALHTALVDGNVPLALGELIQLLKALHQAALDSGRWRTACHMCILPDPLGRQEFGGSQTEMQTISTYQAALGKLRVAVAGKGAGPGGPATGQGDGAGADQAAGGGPAAADGGGGGKAKGDKKGGRARP